MARINLWTAARGAVVLLVMGSLVSGFSGASGPGPSGAGGSYDATTGTTASAQIDGTIVGLDTMQTPPLVLVSTASGQVYILLSDPTLANGLTLGATVAFSGTYLTADVFNAFQVSGGATAAELSLGAPLGGSTTASTGGTTSTSGATSTWSTSYTTTATTNSNSSNSNNANDNSGCSTDDNLNDNDDNLNDNGGNLNDNDDNDNEDCSTPTPTPTQTACGASPQFVALDPTSKTRKVGATHQIDVTVSQSGNCSGRYVYLTFDGSSANNAGLTLAPKVLDSSNHAVLSYVGTATGTDQFTIWVDADADTVQDSGEPFGQGIVTWTAASSSSISSEASRPTSQPSAPATATATATPKATATATATATLAAKPSSTPTPTRTPKSKR